MKKGSCSKNGQERLRRLKFLWGWQGSKILLVGFVIFSGGSQEANIIKIHITATFYVAHSLSNFCSSSDTPCCYEKKKEKWVTKKRGGLLRFFHGTVISKSKLVLDKNCYWKYLLSSLRLCSLVLNFWFRNSLIDFFDCKAVT